MPTLTAGELTLLGTHPHSFKEYLAVLQPATVLACQLNGAPSGDPVTSITYDGITEGAFAPVAVKVEGRNPANSVKCRIGAAMIWNAEERGILKPGSKDVTIIEPEAEWTVNPEDFVSKGKNTPWAGCQLKGKVMATIVRGEVAYKDNVIRLISGHKN